MIACSNVQLRVCVCLKKNGRCFVGFLASMGIFVWKPDSLNQRDIRFALTLSHPVAVHVQKKKKKKKKKKRGLRSIKRSSVLSGVSVCVCSRLLREELVAHL